MNKLISNELIDKLNAQIPKTLDIKNTYFILIIQIIQIKNKKKKNKKL